MAIVTEISWDDMLDGKPLPGNPTRRAWRQAVSEVAERAKAALPVEENGRIEKAVAIVLAGDVEVLEGGKAKVASQSNGQTVYHIANGTCDCADFPRAPQGQCKHKIARGIHIRATALAKQRLAQLDIPTNGTGPLLAEQPHVQPIPDARASAAALPEAPASVNCHITLEGRQVQVTLRDTDETRLLTRLAALLRQYPLAQPPVQPPAHDTTQPTQTPVCQWHGAMRESSKATGTWYCPAKMADGSYCKARHPAKGK